jgi:outer membrane protein insertion porin family
MTNIKIEPRYFLTDNAVVGFFLDGGNVQVDHYVPFELRTSVGLSFKYYTPVGSFDLAYGHKLNRQKTPDGELESSGRLHFTIGFF